MIAPLEYPYTTGGESIGIIASPMCMYTGIAEVGKGCARDILDHRTGGRLISSPITARV
jgi:hypothetical protein